MSDLVPRNQLSKQGVTGVVAIAGGIGTFIVQGLIHTVSAIGTVGHFHVGGLIIGGVVTLIGLALSGGKKGRAAGVITAVAGAAVAVASLPIVGGIAQALMWIGGAGLIVTGVVSLWRFFSNLRKRM
jgi:hypothetical protein